MIYKVIYEKDDLSFTGVILDVSEFETLELDQHFMYVIAGVREFIRNKKINYFFRFFINI